MTAGAASSTRGIAPRSNVQMATSQPCDEQQQAAGRAQHVPHIRALVHECRGAGAKQAAQDINQLLAMVTPDLYFDVGAYFWLTCEMCGGEPRVAVHLLQRCESTNTRVFSMAVKADGRPADMVALGSGIDLAPELKQEIGRQFKVLQPQLQQDWYTYSDFKLKVGDFSFPLHYVLHVRWS